MIGQLSSYPQSTAVATPVTRIELNTAAFPETSAKMTACLALLLVLLPTSITAQPTTTEQWLSYDDLARQNSHQFSVLLQKVARMEAILLNLQAVIGSGGAVPGFTSAQVPTTTTPHPDHTERHVIDPNVRLVGGSSSSSGRLEVRHNNRWGTVCDDNFGGAEANVVCKSLGYSAGMMRPSSAYGQGTLEILLDDLQCVGTEEVLFDCGHGGWGVHNCGHSEDVGLDCYPGPLGTKIHYLEDIESDMGSKGIQYLGYISVDETDLTIVSCSNLLDNLPGGFANGAELLDAGGNFGCWKSTRGLDDPGRTGACQPNYQQSTSLASCMRCTHMFICIDYPGASEVRLAGSTSEGRGRLEVFHNGWWGTVCNAEFGSQDALVVCKNFGFELGFPVQSSVFGQGEGPIWLSGIQCEGHESGLMECGNPGWGVHTCSHSRDVGVTCERGPCGSRMHYLGVVGPASAARGFNDLCYISRAADSEFIGTTCSDLVRDMLGGYRDSAALIAAGGNFGCWRGTASVGDPGREAACTAGHQTSLKLSDCSSCTVMFICINYPTSITVRLTGLMSTTSSGRLEILHGGSWGTVCDDDFSDLDASVVCRSLGFHYGVHRPSAAFGEGTGEILLDNVNCLGNETRLEECGHQGWGSHNCGHSEDVAVECHTLDAI